MKKLNTLEYRRVIERLAPETTNPTYDYDFDRLSNIFDDMSYHEHIALIEKLLSTNLTKEDRALQFAIWRLSLIRAIGITALREKGYRMRI